MNQRGIRIPEKGWRSRETHLKCKIRDWMVVGEPDRDGNGPLLRHDIVLFCPRPYIPQDRR